VICDLSSAVITSLMLLHAPVAVLLVLIFLAGLITPVFAGVRAAIVPEMLGTGPEFVLGRAIYSMVWSGSQVVGFALGGLLLAVIGARGSLAIDAASFLGSALLVRIGIKPRTATAPGEGNVIRASLHSVGTVWRDRRLRRLMLVHWLVPTCSLAPEAIIAPYVAHIGGPSRDVGLLLSAIAGGMLVSNLLGGRLLTVRWQRRLMPAFAILCVAPLIGFLAHIGFWVSFGLLALTGLGAGWNLGRDSYFIAILPEDLRSRGLTIDQSGLMVVQGLGFVFWGGVAEVLPLRTTIAVAGAFGVLIVTLLGHTPETDA
jgi:MFS family permease